MEKLEARDETNSVLWLHAIHHHQGREEEVEFEMRVTGSYNDPLDGKLWRASRYPTSQDQC